MLSGLILQQSVDMGILATNGCSAAGASTHVFIVRILSRFLILGDGFARILKRKSIAQLSDAFAVLVLSTILSTYCAPSSGASRTFTDHRAVMEILKKHPKDWEPPPFILLRAMKEKPNPVFRFGPREDISDTV